MLSEVLARHGRVLAQAARSREADVRGALVAARRAQPRVVFPDKHHVVMDVYSEILEKRLG